MRGELVVRLLPWILTSGYDTSRPGLRYDFLGSHRERSLGGEPPVPWTEARLWRSPLPSDLAVRSSTHALQALSSPPSGSPSFFPSEYPSGEPTYSPTLEPSELPTSSTASPSTSFPTPTPASPTEAPTGVPTLKPTQSSETPSGVPTSQPSQPSGLPTSEPTYSPSLSPTGVPSAPSRSPTRSPTSPLGLAPTSFPSIAPIVRASFVVSQQIHLTAHRRLLGSQSSLNTSATQTSVENAYISSMLAVLNLTSPEFNCTSVWLALNLTETCEVSILTGFIPSVSQITQLLSSPSFQATLDQALLSSNVSASLSSPSVTSIFGPTGKFGP